MIRRFALLLAAVCLIPAASRADMLVAGFSGDAVYRFNSSGTYLGVFASHPTLMDGPTAMVYNTGGNLLVLNEFSHNVLKFDGATGAYISEFISPSTLSGAGATDPADMEIGLDGNLYVMSHFNDFGNIYKFDGSSGAFLGVFAANPPTHHQHGLAFGPGGHLYQGNIVSGLVEKYDGGTGAFLGNLTAAPVGPFGDLIFGPTHLYAAGNAGGGLARFDATTGAFISYLVSPGSSFWGMTIDGGILYVSNTGTGEIRMYDTTSPTDTFLGDFIATGPGAFDLLVMPVPEPTSAALLLIGGCATFLFSRRFATRS
ncbi:MAG: PEP-CTERM sorting domain-containing protein [Verrucomicrobia bacterium]|nr:MAG: PEP-CTERM sorting domain-containing protein [Verrucomicrobiota bacterium]